MILESVDQFVSVLSYKHRCENALMRSRGSESRNEIRQREREMIRKRIETYRGPAHMIGHS
jgi:uncharacterized protein YbgA (DUF1722 family)